MLLFFSLVASSDCFALISKLATLKLCDISIANLSVLYDYFKAHFQISMHLIAMVESHVTRVSVHIKIILGLHVLNILCSPRWCHSLVSECTLYRD